MMLTIAQERLTLVGRRTWNLGIPLSDSIQNLSTLQGHSVDKKMAKPHEQLFFLNFKKMATFLRLSFLKK